jgi:phosphoribosyl 1,2-cyclic phosphodiesterase/CheY-like chemotaxis protein
MFVRFWGTRGSIPKPGPTTLKYGGNTSCVQVQSAAGTVVMLDCGTGAVSFGAELMRSGKKPIRGNLLISHTHWDHIQGLPFFAPLFVPGNEWDVYAPRGFEQSVRETLAGQMQSTYFPVELEQLGAAIRYHDLTEGVFSLGDIRVSTQYLNHPALALGYRLEADGVIVVYACDHEPHSRALAYGSGDVGGQDQRHAEFLAGADLLIHDAQYRASEYESKIGWGHSTIEYVIAMAQLAEVKSVALTHHDPLRDDDTIDKEVAEIREQLKAQGASLEVFAAAEGPLLEIKAHVGRKPKRQVDEPSAEAAVSSRLSELIVLMGIADPSLNDLLWQTLHTEGVKVLRVTDGASALRLAQTDEPSLIILDRYLHGVDSLETCRAIRAASRSKDKQVPIVIVAAQEDAGAGNAAGVTDWLVKPFSTIYARTRMRAWLLRTACRWAPAPLPEDEPERLAALHRLDILDTEPEERFDKLTRIAAALFDVPIALISMVDENRQWFKSAYGTSVCEGPRDMSFCAHAILATAVMIVPDALLDSRFADNPVVVNDPRVRFYAGCPLVSDGRCVGTLCLIDIRPRDLDATAIRLLQDLAELVLQELQRTEALAKIRAA